MGSNYHERRFSNICHQISELALGNFTFRITTTERRDHYDGTSSLLNMLAEELPYLYVNLKQSDLQHLPPLVFNLDKEFKIIKHSANYKKILKLEKAEILGTDFRDLLTKKSADSINRLISEREYPISDSPIELIVDDGLLYPTTCSIQLMNSIGMELEYIITVFNDVPRKDIEQEEIEKSIWNKKSINHKIYKKSFHVQFFDKKLIDKLEEYILNHLDTQLPNIHDLASILGSSKTKLNNNFKDRHGIPIHQFHTQKRMEQGMTLLKTTDFTIAEIAEKCGYKDHSHFSRTFKKYFKFSPREIGRD